MNKLSKDIFKSWDNWYKTVVNISKELKHDKVNIELIRYTSQVLINDINTIDCDGSSEFKEVYSKMITGLVNLCEKQAKITKSDSIAFKLFKKNIKDLKAEFKKGYKG
jgi:hypothetical protein